jgi:hypothetical protein
MLIYINKSLLTKAPRQGILGLKFPIYIMPLLHKD